MRTRSAVLIACVVVTVGLVASVTSNSFHNFVRPSVGLPVRLVIPAIKIDAPIELVGLTSDGAMDVPKSQGAVAWYDLGPRPGEFGSAVIDGHFGVLKNGAPSVFDDLSALQPGDSIKVIDEAGIEMIFVVGQIRNYDPLADATDVFNSSDGKAHLNLITCEGVWNKQTKNYSQRLVVFAEKD